MLLLTPPVCPMMGARCLTAVTTWGAGGTLSSLNIHSVRNKKLCGNKLGLDRATLVTFDCWFKVQINLKAANDIFTLTARLAEVVIMSKVCAYYVCVYGTPQSKQSRAPETWRNFFLRHPLKIAQICFFPNFFTYSYWSLGISFRKFDFQVEGVI